jgi:single-strand DNA-binding protein
MNSTQLLGRLTKDPELKYGASGNAYCKFTLAVNRAFKKDETDFINCTAFGKAAETIAEYVRKGDQFAVTGRIQTDVYEKDGEKRYSTGVMVDGFTFISKAKGEGSSSGASSKPEKEKPAGNQGAPNIEFEDDDEFPF